MKKLKALKLTIKILFNFFKDKCYKGQETLEDDLKRYIDKHPNYKKQIEFIKKGF